MHSMAPRPCFFMCSRARSVRYFFSRSQLTRCCQSNPAMPKFAVPMVSPGSKPCGFAVDENSSRLIPIAEDHIAASPFRDRGARLIRGRTGLQLLRLPAERREARNIAVSEAALVPSIRVLPGIGFQPRRLDAGDPAGLVAVRRIAGNDDGAG